MWLSSRIWTNQRGGLWSRDLPPPITAHLDVGEAAEGRLVQGGHLVVLQPQYLQVGQLRQRGVVNLKSNQIFLVHQIFPTPTHLRELVVAEVEGAEAGVDSLEEELGHAGDEVVAGVQQLDQGRGRHHAP